MMFWEISLRNNILQIFHFIICKYPCSSNNFLLIFILVHSAHFLIDPSACLHGFLIPRTFLVKKPSPYINFTVIRMQITLLNLSNTAVFAFLCCTFSGCFSLGDSGDFDKPAVWSNGWNGCRFVWNWIDHQMIRRLFWNVRLQSFMRV